MSMALQALDAGNYEYALGELKRLSSEGVARADFELGRLYWNGQGLSRDRKRALQLMLAAADAGLSDARFAFNLLSHQEIMTVACQSDTAGDFKFAIVLLEQLADLGSLDAKYVMGTIYESRFQTKKGFEQAVSLYLEAASQGHEAALAYVELLKEAGRLEAFTRIHSNHRGFPRRRC
jgi:TPR repeat protein